MTTIKSILGYIIAFICIPFAMASFIGSGAWAKLLVTETGLKISPWETGGDVVRTVSHGAYETRIYKPVFDALIGQRSEGFVQVDWRKKKAVPVQIDEQVDFDGDGKNDFRIQWNTRTNAITMTPENKAIIDLRGHYTMNERYAVRINLRNQGR